MSIKAPAFLQTSGKRRFQHLAKQVKKPTDTQVQLLALLSQSWESYLCALKDVNEKGMSVLSGNRLFKNPAQEMLVKERASIIELSNLLGLIPEVIQEKEKSAPRSPLEAMMRSKQLIGESE